MKSLKREDLMKAHEEGCSDVKTVLENLYPDEFDKGVLSIRGDGLYLGENRVGDAGGTSYIYTIYYDVKVTHPSGNSTKVEFIRK